MIATTVRARAAAKINLHLGVGRAPRRRLPPAAHRLPGGRALRRPDRHRRPGWSLATRARTYIGAADLPAPADDIVTRAALLLATRHGVAADADVLVDKAIPVAGGLAGGSADAAAALVALDRLWELRPPAHELLALAAELGSDVPFALLGGTALGTGRGEIVAPVPDRGTWWWVVVPSRDGLSTPEVYRHFDELFPDAATAPPRGDALLAALATGDPHALARDPAQRPAGAGVRPAPRPARADRARRVARVRCGASCPAPARPASSCASPRRTPRPWPSGLRAPARRRRSTATGPGARRPPAGRGLTVA